MLLIQIQPLHLEAYLERKNKEEELKENSLPIGMIDINNTWSKYSSVEPGYIIARKYWGFGYATEATKRVMKYM